MTKHTYKYVSKTIADLRAAIDERDREIKRLQDELRETRQTNLKLSEAFADYKHKSVELLPFPVAVTPLVQMEKQATWVPYEVQY